MPAEREDAQMRGVGGVDGDVMRHSYKWAIKLSPRWVDGYYNLGNLLLATNQVEKAIERLQVAGAFPVCVLCLQGARVGTECPCRLYLQAVTTQSAPCVCHECHACLP
jgi:hypothetical protein